MRKHNHLIRTWLRFVGKDKLQTFQDNFARTYGVSLNFLDLDGQPITVGSNNNLFCFTIEKAQSIRCQEHFQNDTATMLHGKPFIHVCPFGLTCLYVPVFFNNCLIAFASVGGITYPDSIIPGYLQERFHITSYSKEKVDEILQLLDSLMRLLNATVLGKDGKTLKRKKILPACMQEDGISMREYEVIQLLCNGYSNKEIGKKLFIGESTVKTHVSNILTKLHLKGRMQIIARYYDKCELPDSFDDDASNN